MSAQKQKQKQKSEVKEQKKKKQKLDVNTALHELGYITSDIAADGVQVPEPLGVKQAAELPRCWDEFGPEVIESALRLLFAEIQAGRKPTASYGVLFSTPGQFEHWARLAEQRVTHVVEDLTEAEATAQYEDTGELPRGYVLTNSGRVLRG